MAAQVSFSDILELLESHGWKQSRIKPPYRIFTKGNDLPILIPVHGGRVSVFYVAKIDQILAEQREEE